MDKVGFKKPEHRHKKNVKVTVIYPKTEEVVNESQQSDNGTNVDGSETDTSATQ